MRSTVSTRVKGQLIAATMIAGGLLVSSPAAAQVLNLQGVVGPYCTLVITPVVGVADNLDLTTVQANANLVVAAVTETCNAALGYVVTAQSAGFSRLVGTNPANFVTYGFRYGGTDHTNLLTSGGAEIVKTTAAPTPAAGTNSVVAIDYTIAGVLGDDTYTDAITFTITAN